MYADTSSNNSNDRKINPDKSRKQKHKISISTNSTTSPGSNQHHWSFKHTRRSEHGWNLNLFQESSLQSNGEIVTSLPSIQETNSCFQNVEEYELSTWSSSWAWPCFQHVMNPILFPLSSSSSSLSSSSSSSTFSSWSWIPSSSLVFSQAHNGDCNVSTKGMGSTPFRRSKRKLYNNKIFEPERENFQFRHACNSAWSHSFTLIDLCVSIHANNPS